MSKKDMASPSAIWAGAAKLNALLTNEKKE
jgi:hypothetical protein